MITITVNYDAKKRVTFFIVDGYSTLPQRGLDVVPAAISVVTTGCVDAIVKLQRVYPAIDNQNGYLTVDIPPDGIVSSGVQLLLSAMVNTLKDLSGNYPNGMTVDEVE